MLASLSLIFASLLAPHGAPGRHCVVGRSRAAAPLALAKKQREPPPPPPETFADLGVKSKPLLSALECMDLHKPMESQVLAWSALRDTTSDVAVVSEAGSGKTLAYLVPLLERLIAESSKRTRQVLHIVVPTHDLTTQVLRTVKDLCADLPQLKLALADDPAAARAADVVVGTATASEKLLAGSSSSRSSSSGGSGGRGGGGGRGGKSKGKSDGRGGRGVRRAPRETKVASLRSAGGAGRDDTSTSGVAPRAITLTVVMDEADFLLAGARASGGKGGASPAAKILDALRRSSKPKAGGKKDQGRGSTADKVTDKGSSKPAAKPAAEAAPTAVADAAGAVAGEPDAPKPPSAAPPPPLARLVFVSATVPGQGAASVGAYLDNRFPSLQWVRSAGAHRPVASLRAEFETVDSPKARDAALMRLLGEERLGRTLVFANSASR